MQLTDEAMDKLASAMGYPVEAMTFEPYPSKQLRRCSAAAVKKNLIFAPLPRQLLFRRKREPARMMR